MKIGYSMPAASRFYPSPPYIYKDNHSINIVFRTTPEALQARVPSPLIPNPGNFAFVYVGEFNVFDPIRASYLEAGIGVPVLFDNKPGNYFLYLYLDMTVAIVAGREIWGWPKKDAGIKINVENGKYQASVVRDEVEIIRASVYAVEPVSPITPSVYVPAINLKIIPSVCRNHPPDVLQLTSAAGASVKKALFRGEASLSLASSPNDPLAELPVLEIISGERSIDDMTLDCGEVLVDYLAQGQQV